VEPLTEFFLMAGSWLSLFLISVLSLSMYYKTFHSHNFCRIELG
jgi:hypothetical protein